MTSRHVARSRSGSPPTTGRIAVAPATRSSSRRAPAAARDGDARRARRQGAAASSAADDTMILGVPDRAGPRRVRARRPRRRVRRRAAVPEPEAEEETARARPPRGRDAAPARPAARARPRARRRAALPRRRAAADGGARRDGGRRRPDRHVPDGRDHGAPRRPRRGARVDARTSSRARSSCSARPQQLARILFEKLELTPGRKGKTGYSTDTRVLRAIRDEHEIVPVIEEWRELLEAAQHVPRAAAGAARRGRPPAHDTSTRPSPRPAASRRSNPNLQAIPIRTELGREIRSAFVAEPGCRLISADYSQVELRILAHVSGEPKLREAFERGEDIHTATAAEVLGKDPATLTKDERNVAKMVNFGIIYGISAFGLSENLEIPRERGAGVHRRVPRALPARAGLHPAHDRAGRARRLRDDACSAGAGRCRRSARSNRQTRALGERLAVNSVMQGTAADIIKVAMVAHPRAAARRGPRRAARAPGARRAPARGARRGDVAR